jgi:hypothetical protein
LPFPELDARGRGWTGPRRERLSWTRWAAPSRAAAPGRRARREGCAGCGQGEEADPGALVMWDDLNKRGEWWHLKCVPRRLVERRLQDGRLGKRGEWWHLKCVPRACASNSRCGGGSSKERPGSSRIESPCHGDTAAAGSKWRAVKGTRSKASGGYKVRIPDRPGLYRAFPARPVDTLNNCSSAKSRTRRPRRRSDALAGGG